MFVFFSYNYLFVLIHSVIKVVGFIFRNRFVSEPDAKIKGFNVSSQSVFFAKKEGNFV